MILICSAVNLLDSIINVYHIHMYAENTIVQSSQSRGTHVATDSLLFAPHGHSLENRIIIQF